MEYLKTKYGLSSGTREIPPSPNKDRWQLADQRAIEAAHHIKPFTAYWFGRGAAKRTCDDLISLDSGILSVRILLEKLMDADLARLRGIIIERVAEMQKIAPRAMRLPTKKGSATPEQADAMRNARREALGAIQAIATMLEV